MSMDFVCTIKGEAVWEARTQLVATLIADGINPWELDLDDLAAQEEVSRVREIAAGLNIFYMSSDWYPTKDGDIEVHFQGITSVSDVMYLKLALA